MPLQNRVLPDASIVACPQRGTMMGNRGGAFHRCDQTLQAKHWHSRQWICCVLAFKGRRREVMQPRRYTELFFLDEATALAAGHRPCFECRRAAATDFATRWNAARGRSGRAIADDMDRILHAERLDQSGHKRTCVAEIDSLPDHVIIRFEGGIARVAGDQLQDWSLDGYGASRPRPSRTRVEILTPPSIVTVLGAGYAPVLHRSAAS
jgi:hypothetical protein